jgi:hypothetical protein
MYIEIDGTTLNAGFQTNNNNLDGRDRNCITNDKGRDEDDDGVVDGPTVEANVNLSKVPCKYCMTISLQRYTY